MAASLETRVHALQCIRIWSPLGEVAEAVATASSQLRRAYVERLGNLYRWSVTHPGGAYPLLRTVARYLEVDHRDLILAVRSLPDGTVILYDDREVIDEPDAWVVLEIGQEVNCETAKELIEFALRS